MTRPNAKRRTSIVVTIAALGLVAASLVGVRSAGAATTVTVSATRAQTIDNIGASGAWWVNDLKNFPPATQQRVAELLFGSSGLELSAYRYNIGGGGVGVTNPARAPQTFQTSPGQYDWSRDQGGQTFLKYAAQYGVKDIIGFVNSAPAIWTSSRKNCGGSFVSGNEAAYARYLADIVQHFADTGVKINYLSPMNEPRVNMSHCIQEGMIVTAARRDEMIRALGAELRSRGLATGISADESNYTTNFNSEVPQWLGQSGTAQYVSSLAHHTYDYPSQAALTTAKNIAANAGKKLWATEVCCFNRIGSPLQQQYDPTITGGLPVADEIYRDFTYANDSAFHWWTAVSPKIGCTPTSSSTCATSVNSSGWNDGLIYYDEGYPRTGDRNVYLTKRYYVLGQFSKFVRPGAVRHLVGGAPSGVQVLAFERAGTWTVVANNLGTTAQDIDVRLPITTAAASGAYRTSASENLAAIALPAVSAGTAALKLPAQSVSTYVFTTDGTPPTPSPTASPSPSPSPSTSPSPPATFRLRGEASGRCLDVNAGSSANGTETIIYDCHTRANQQFSQNGQELRVLGKCLEVPANSAAGARARIWDCTGGANQQWTFNSNGTISNGQNGLCLDVNAEGTINGTAVIVWTCHTGTNQRWTRA